MTWWNAKSHPDDEPDSVDLNNSGYLKVLDEDWHPGTIIPCDDPQQVTKIQTGYEWFEWSHGGKGVPWRVNTEEFNQMLMDGWEIVDICNSFTLLKRPTFVHYLDTPRLRNKK